MTDTSLTPAETASDSRAFSAADGWRYLIKTGVIAVYVWGIFFSSFSQQETLAFVSYVAAFAIIYSFLLGYVKVFVLSQNAVIGVGAYTFAIIQTRSGSLLLATVVAVVASSVALVITVLPSVRIEGFQLALVSVSMGVLFTAAVANFTDLTGGSTGLYQFDSWLKFTPIETRDSLLFATAILAVTGLIVAISVSGRSGRLLVAAGDDEFLTRVIGGNVTVIRIWAAAWCGVLTGLVATLFVQNRQIAAPDTYSFRLLIQVFLVLMVGGRRSTWGPIAASAIVIGIPGWVGGIDGDLLQVVFSALVVIVVVIRPDGMDPDPIRDRNGPRSLLPRFISNRFGGARTALDVTEAVSESTVVSETPNQQLGEIPNEQRIESIKVTNLTKRFGGVFALDKANMTAHTGEVVGVVGPNGSGKTTLLNCLSGVWTPEEGSIELLTDTGEGVWHANTYRLARAGLGRSFQVPRIAAGLSLRDNLRLAGDARKTRVSDEALEDVIDRFGLRPWVDKPTLALSHGIRRWTELARLDLSNSSILLLDEPAAGLTDEEIEQLKGVIERWRDEGRGIILVEHHHHLVAAVADKTIVMSFGQVLAEGVLEELRLDPQIREIIGERLT